MHRGMGESIRTPCLTEASLSVQIKTDCKGSSLLQAPFLVSLPSLMSYTGCFEKRLNDTWDLMFTIIVSYTTLPHPQTAGTIVI